MTGRVTVFLSGKLISTGAKSSSESIEQLQKTMNLLVNAKFVRPAQLMPKIQNIVATLDIKNKIDLNTLSIALSKITYEPSQFPGAILRTSNGPVCLIFSTGKVVIVGSKSEEQITECVNILVKILDKFLIHKRPGNTVPLT
jgi:transcription initiation factor TFIID TATA-box-binding protein